MSPDSWYQQPAAQALIKALHDLAGVAATLETFRASLWQHDPEAVIGEFRQEQQAGLVHHAGRTWVTNGGSATEACLESLTDLRDEWIRNLCKEDGDDVPDFRIERDTPTVDDAIHAWRRERDELARAA